MMLILTDGPQPPAIRANPHWHAPKHLFDRTKELQPGLEGCWPLASYEWAMGGAGERYNKVITFPDGTHFKIDCSGGNMTLRQVR